LESTAAAAERCARQERLLEERRRVLGEENPDTLTAMLDLADCLWAQGRLIAARRLEEQVVAERRRQLGEDHFDTLMRCSSMWSRRYAACAVTGTKRRARQTKSWR